MRVLVADDIHVTRLFVRRLIQAKTDCEVVGEAEDVATAVREAQRLKPDVVILDLHLPEMGAVVAARMIKESLPDTLIVVRCDSYPLAVEEVLEQLGIYKLIEKIDDEGLIAALSRP